MPDDNNLMYASAKLELARKSLDNAEDALTQGDEYRAVVHLNSSAREALTGATAAAAALDTRLSEGKARVMSNG